MPSYVIFGLIVVLVVLCIFAYYLIKDKATQPSAWAEPPYHHPVDPEPTSEPVALKPGVQYEFTENGVREYTGENAVNVLEPQDESTVFKVLDEEISEHVDATTGFDPSLSAVKDELIDAASKDEAISGDVLITTEAEAAAPIEYRKTPLSVREVKEIRSSRSSYTALATQYRVSVETIRKIKNGIIYNKPRYY